MGDRFLKFTAQIKF